MKIALVGYGRMGHEIESVAKQRGHSIELIIDKDNVEQFTAENLKSVDVVIEFTTPSEAFANVCKAFKAGVPVVSGTTGWLDKMEEARRVCLENNGAFFYASNFSIGVNVMFAVNRKLAQLMRDFSQYDVTVEETHHTGKVDAPSGTAITLAQGILENSDRKKSWVEGWTTNPSELGVTSVRRGVVPGVHTITWESDQDTIVLSHSAKNRRGLAMGAVLAAEYVADKKGIFSMNDMLGI
jgi:4-hydroxy-tetrahydrodipicolinate reductase